MISVRLNSIQILRGLAALAVVAFHARLNLNVYEQKNLGDLMFHNGEAGVYLFFVISGFIISFSTRKKETPLEFSIKRIFRIYPPYVISLALILIIIETKYGLASVLKAFLLMPLDSNQPGPFYGYNILIVAWTLSFEAFFYACFLISLMINYKYRALICSIFIAAIVYFGNKLLFGHAGVNPHTAIYPNEGSWFNLIFVTNPIMLNFILGMLAEFVYSKTNVNTGAINKTIKLFSPIVALISVWAIMSPPMWIGETQWAYPCFALVLSLALLEKAGVNFEIPKLVMLGTISYSIYLIHPVVIEIVSQKYFVVFWQNGFTKFFVIILMTIFIAKIMYEFIEKPSQLFSRKIIAKVK